MGSQDRTRNPNPAQRRREAETLRSILDDYIAAGGWTSEPQQRRALYAWSALAGATGDPRDDW